MAVDEGGLAERLARRVHQNYLDDQIRSGRPLDGTGGMRPWEELSEDLKLANRAQVDDIIAKLEQIGCAISTAKRPRKRPFILKEDEVERLARREHDRWCAERRSRGWKPGRTRDDARLIHPSLCPWEDLPESERDKDRDAIRHIPDLLAEAGLRVVRRRSAPGSDPIPTW